jgi:hypothetical protein
MTVVSMKLTPGIFISEDMLKKAGISENEVKIEVLSKLIKITPFDESEKIGPLAKNSPLWDMVSMGDIEGSRM